MRRQLPFFFIMKKEKIAFITGAAKGIGKSTAAFLASKGCKVYITDIDLPVLEKTTKEFKKEGFNVVASLLDVCDAEAVEKQIQKIVLQEGNLHYCVNNAGIQGPIAPLTQISIEDWERTLKVNLSSVFYCLQSQIKALIGLGGGNIVNVASMAGLNGAALGGPYVASKHGVIGLTKTAAIEVGAYNIRVNAVCPGFINTEMIDNVPKKILDYTTNIRVPMKRIGEPEEVAKTIYWLLSSESSYVNGHTMVIDGGMYSG